MGAIWDAVVGEQWPVIKQAPHVCIVVFIFGVIVGALSGYWYYTDRLNDQKERIERLKIAAGMAEPSAKTALTALTNSELKWKSNRLVERIREIVSIHQEHLGNIMREKQGSRMTDEQWKARFDQENQRAWKQFETVRADALMVSDELRGRLSPHVHEKIVTATPHFRSADDPKAELSITRLASSLNVMAAVFLAGEIEELSKLQLNRLETCSG